LAQCRATLLAQRLDHLVGQKLAAHGVRLAPVVERDQLIEGLLEFTEFSAILPFSLLDLPLLPGQHPTVRRGVHAPQRGQGKKHGQSEQKQSRTGFAQVNLHGKRSVEFCWWSGPPE